MEDCMIDVIIPLYRPDQKFEKLIKGLNCQDITPHRILLLNTEVIPEYSSAAILERINKIPNQKIEIELISIKKDQFDHGGTRALGATMSKAEYLLFMTQDAVPKDSHLITELLKSFDCERVAVAFARQIVRKNAGLIESYTREFNYPDRSMRKGEEDIKHLGIKTYFCSNVCAMYKRAYYEELGGFVRKTIFNEDMIFAQKVIGKGYQIAYVATACVVHSHAYTCWEQLQRNFDLGVSQAEYKEVFKDVPSEKEGAKMVKMTISYLLKHQKYGLILLFIIECGFKYVGYFLGKRYQKLPVSVCKKLSMNKGYWKNYV